MAGLIDSATGLGYGTGLQFQNPIGGAGLINQAGGVLPTDAYVTEDGLSYYVTEDGLSYYVQE